MVLPEVFELLADHLGDEAPEALVPAEGDGERLGQQLLQGDAERSGQAVEMAKAQLGTAAEHVAEGAVPDRDLPFEVADGAPAVFDQDAERLAQSFEILFHRAHSAAKQGCASPSFTAFCKDENSSADAAACEVLGNPGLAGSPFVSFLHRVQGSISRAGRRGEFPAP